MPKGGKKLSSFSSIKENSCTDLLQVLPDIAAIGLCTSRFWTFWITIKVFTSNCLYNPRTSFGIHLNQNFLLSLLCLPLSYLQFSHNQPLGNIFAVAVIPFSTMTTNCTLLSCQILIIFAYCFPHHFTAVTKNVSATFPVSNFPSCALPFFWGDKDFDRPYRLDV